MDVRLLLELTLAEEMKRRILSELESGSKTDEELRRSLLGERPRSDRKDIRQYDTSYQALRRALEDLVQKQLVAEPRYRRLEVAETHYLGDLLRRYSKARDNSRLLYVMEEVRFECAKSGAAWTKGIVEFLRLQMDHDDPKIRELAFASLRGLVTNLDDAKKGDRELLHTLTDQVWSLSVKQALTKDDKSVAVRQEAISLLAELGRPEAIDTLTEIVKRESNKLYAKLFRSLKDALCRSYDEEAGWKNRLLRDYKSTVREALLGLAESGGPEVKKRGEQLLWHFRTGGKYPA